MNQLSCYFCKKENTYNHFKTFLNEDLKCYDVACLECFKSNKLHYADKSPGWVYLIGFDDFWKCGFTTSSPTTRLLSIQQCNPHEVSILEAWLVGDCKAAERLAHSKLAQFHIRGEWFEAEPDELLEVLNVLFSHAQRYRLD